QGRGGRGGRPDERTGDRHPANGVHPRGGRIDDRARCQAAPGCRRRGPAALAKNSGGERVPRRRRGSDPAQPPGRGPLGTLGEVDTAGGQARAGVVCLGWLAKTSASAGTRRRCRKPSTVSTSISVAPAKAAIAA